MALEQMKMLRNRPRQILSTYSANIVYDLSFVITIIFALTGFVCTYKIQAEEECLSSNIACYECDSRYDPNCADPFEFSSLSLRDQQKLAARSNLSNSLEIHHGLNHSHINTGSTDLANNRQQHDLIGNTTMMMPKKQPNSVACHGCCVKMTSKTPEGLTYFKRTCTTNLQINYFMVGLVCMKESGDRGKMCFCETDFCNGQPGIYKGPAALVILGFLILAIPLATRRSIPYSQVMLGV